MGPPIFFLTSRHWQFARRFQYDASGTNVARCPSKPFLPVALSRHTKRFRMQSS